MVKALIYFTRVPLMGRTKKRLEDFLTLEEIRAVSEYLLKKNFNEIKTVDADIFIYADPAEKIHELNTLLELTDEVLRPQVQSSSLGGRMLHAVEEVHEEGYTDIILMGSDFTDLTKELVNNAFDKLTDVDVVVAPSADGGYGLIGMHRGLSAAFDLPKYGTSDVLEKLQLQLEKNGCSYELTGLLHDIDDKEDIAKYLAGDQSAEFIAQGEYNANFLIDNGSKLLRIALGSQMDLDNQIAYEFHALKALEPSGVVPKVFHLEEETELLGKGFLIEEFLPGRPLQYETDLETAAYLLAQIHQVDIAKAPHLITAEAPLQAMLDECQKMFSHYKNWGKKDQEIVEKIEYIFDFLKRYDLDKPLENPCIINTELNSGNFLINEEGKSYVIDWEKPLVGEKEQDLGHFLAPTTTLWKTDVSLSESDIKRFVEAYNDYSPNNPVDEEKLVHYIQLTCLRGLTWSAMAYVQYVDSDKPLKNSDTFEVISRYLTTGFLDHIIEQYMQRK